MGPDQHHGGRSEPAAAPDHRHAVRALWGVPAAADPGHRYLVKNGWLPNPALWSINSIGEIEHDQDQLLVAVLSDGNSTEDAGISAVQAVVQKAADAMTGG